jgi:hypothetical protein
MPRVAGEVALYDEVVGKAQLGSELSVTLAMAVVAGHCRQCLFQAGSFADEMPRCSVRHPLLRRRVLHETRKCRTGKTALGGAGPSGGVVDTGRAQPTGQVGQAAVGWRDKDIDGLDWMLALPTGFEPVFQP